MPRISDKILDCVIYLYPSAMAANAGEKAGGSGFLVGIRSQARENTWYLYAVTNSHVIREGKSPIVRLNTLEGKHDVLDVKAQEWKHHPDGDDLAVWHLGLSPEVHDFEFIPTDMFLTHDVVSQYAIGPGDDVFMVGRFISHEGKQRNIPSLRFGNIAMMPWEPVRHPTRGILQESFLVEARSMSGYSGSPVFVHIPPLAARPSSKALETRGYGPWLLGVDWGHIPVREYVKEKNGQVVSEGWWVNYNAGMMGVVPAWKLIELLDTKELKEPRERLENKLAKEKKQES